MTWSAAKIEQLRVMIAEGETTAVIAEKLGVTRNAIIGKTYRLNFKRLLPAVRLKGKGALEQAHQRSAPPPPPPQITAPPPPEPPRIEMERTREQGRRRRLERADEAGEADDETYEPVRRRAGHRWTARL